MKIPMAIASALLLGGVLTACGGDGGSDDTGGSSSDYCKDLKKASTSLTSVTNGDPEKIDQAFATFHNLADAAPGAIKDDWAIYDNAITTLEDGLKEAGVTFSDLANAKPGETPEGVDRAELTKLMSKISKLGDQEFVAAGKAIEAHAKNTCKVDMAKIG